MEAVKSYKRSDIISILADLNFLVTTLARIGSNYHDNTKKMLVHELFMRDTNIFQKLSKARSILSDAFSRELGEDDMEELEKELQHLERWEFPTDEKLAKFEKEILK